MSQDPPPQEAGRFGTFAGVLRPTTLTILGAMLYLREGWLVGNSGLLGALVVIVGAHIITGTTALSVSTLATNVRVRPGGAFAIISQALGLEAGGAIGIPLFIAQSASAAMYLYAFTEGWAVIFPDHPPALVVGGGFALVGVVSLRSAALAARAQAAMLWVVGIAVSSALLGLFTHDLHAPTWLSGGGEADLTEAFAIFFPAATGIMVGVGMSGSLADPKRSIPTGTMGAWGIGFTVYLLAAFWYASVGTPAELVANKTLMVDRAVWGPLVLAGLLSSTTMAALSTLVAAPRLLQAMATHGVVPASSWLAVLSGGEPRRASLVSLVLTGLFLTTGSLDAIAPIVTAVFIATYLSINLVVSLEQRLAMISWRPTFRVGRLVPPIGAVACTVGLFLTSPGQGLLLVVLILGTWRFLTTRELMTPWETVRSGIAVSLAAWAARQTSDLERSERAWKPDLLLPAHGQGDLDLMVRLARALTRQAGSVKLVGLGEEAEMADMVEQAAQELRASGVYTSWTVLSESRFGQGTVHALDAMRGAFFPPNLVLAEVSPLSDAELQQVLDRCRRLRVGLALFLPHPEGGLGPDRSVAVWLSDRAPEWRLDLHMANLDLPVLIGILLAGSPTGLRLVTAVRDPADIDGASRFQRRLMDMGRLPAGTLGTVVSGPFPAVASEVPRASMHLVGLGPTAARERLFQIRDSVGGACLFLLDSGQESILA